MSDIKEKIKIPRHISGKGKPLIKAEVDALVKEALDEGIYLSEEEVEQQMAEWRKQRSE